MRSYRDRKTMRAKRREQKPQSPQKVEAKSHASTTPYGREVTAAEASTEHRNSVAWRIAGALGSTPSELAVLLGVRPEQVAEMFKGTSGTSPVAAGNPAWAALGRLVDEQIGLLLGVRAEIEGKRELDAKRLRERMERAKL